MKKKFLALVLTLAMVLSLAPVGALATNGEEESQTPEDVIYDDTAHSGNATVDGVESLNKTAKKTGENTYEVKLEVKMYETTSTISQAAATVLVIDVSNSMNDPTCGKEEHAHTDRCYTTYKKCTKKDNPDHWTGLVHKRSGTDCQYDLWEGWIYQIDPILSCKKEKHTHDSSCYPIAAAKEAANSFVDTYAGTVNGASRYLSIVVFGTNAYVQLNWTDVSTSEGKASAKSVINDLSVNGGTNLEQGLAKAKDQFEDSKVVSVSSKNVVALTDGAPTHYGESGWFGPSGSGSSGSKKINKETAETAKKLKAIANLYTVCFGAENTKTYSGGPTVGDFLKDSIATDSSHAYNADNADQLNKAFEKISQTITSGLSAGTVQDALPQGVTSSDADFTTDWDLSSFTKTEEKNGDRTDYTYTKTYTVTIDPEKIDATKLENGYYPLNDRTTLTVKTGDTNTVLDFPIPAGKVTATITFKSEEGGTIGENQTEISNSYASGSDFPTIPATTANDGYTFDGWYDKDGKKVETFPATVTGSATYTAKWTKDTTPPKPDSTDVYVYFQTQNTNGQKVNISGIGEINYNGHDWATLGKISTTRTLTSGTQYTGTDSTLVAVGNEANTKLTGNALWNGNASIAPTVLAHIQWTKLAQLDGADDYYVEAGTTCWHLDGQITGYKVTYATGAGNEKVIGMPTSNETYYLSGSEYTVSDATPQRTGYTFGGWMYQNSDDTTYQANDKFNMLNEDVTLTAQWTPNNGTKYKVEHYQQKLDGTYERTDTDTLSGETGASVIAQPKTTYTGFTCDKTVTGTVESGTIVADGSLVLKLYYTRNSYSVTYQYEGTAPTGAPAVNTLSGTYKYGAEVTVDTTVSANAVAGYTFSGWSTADATVTDGKFTMPANDVTLKGKFEEKTNPLTYTINQHFMDGEGKEIPSLYVSGGSQTGNKDTLLSNLIEGMTGTQSKGDKNYVYVSSKTTYTAVGEEAKPLDTTTSRLTKDTTIDLYYYLDNWKDGSSVEEDNEKGGDGIPDCDQVLIEYVSSNSERGTVSPDMEVLTIRKGNKTVVPTANGSTATTTGSSRNYFSNWTKDNTQVSTNATLNHQTILEVIKEFTGGKTYTFTANFGRSSGSGSGGSNRPKPPVVEIPDDVPTGLNGKDHYAYVVGYPDGMVYPQKNITRAEVATIFFRLLTDETREANMTKSNSYNDMKDGAWYTCAVSTLSKMGIIKGYEDGSFKPDASISRAEFAAIAARFDPDGDKTPATFSDVSSHWAKDEISIAANHGWIKGYEDGSFKPDQKITRAETMTLVNRVLKRLPETKDDLHKDMKTWPDNQNESAWFYLAVQEATNSHYQKLKKDGTHETWESMRETRDWAALEK